VIEVSEPWREEFTSNLQLCGAHVFSCHSTHSLSTTPRVSSFFCRREQKVCVRRFEEVLLASSCSLWLRYLLWSWRAISWRKVWDPL